ncbi:MAG TPA: segregation/condensation protein A [Phycisphaerae bacterium]|nr:segregation/condensation protein A [Phycisphaerae bacterium]
MTYKVELDIYNGPMDLLLYLIKREEVEITDLPIARIADQYIAYLDMLKALDIELAGDFVVMAATLLELKSRALLPRPPELEDDEDGEAEDPRETLIRQLIDYRRFKEAAGLLGDRGREMARRFPRQFDSHILREIEAQTEDLPPEDLLQGVAVWDLITTFGNVIRTLGYSEAREVVYDDTPVEEAANELMQRLEAEKSLRFTDLFAGGRGVNYCIAMFLAILELVRQRRIGAEQSTDFKDLRIYLRDPQAEEPVKQVRPKGAQASREALKRKRPRRPSAQQVDNVRGMMEDVEFEKTEFDEILEAIDVPEVERFHPIYSDDELMGRTHEDDDVAKPADDGSTDDVSSEAAEAETDDAAEGETNEAAEPQSPDLEEDREPHAEEA